MKASSTVTTAQRPGLGILLMMLAMLCFAAMDAVSKHLAGLLSIPQIMWVRYILFTLLAVAVLKPARVRNVLRSGQPVLQAARGALLVVENSVFVLAFTYMPLADMHAIAAASPLIVVALSVPILGERVGLRRWLAVVAGFIGVLVIIRPGFQAFGLPMLLGVAGAFLWGLYQVLVRLCARTDSSETTWLWSALVGLLLTSIAGPATWVWPDRLGWALLVLVAILGSGAHLALIRALTVAEAGSLQPYSYTMLLWAAIFGAVVFGDIPDAWTWVGAAIVMTSGLYAWHRERLRVAEAARSGSN